MRTYNDLVDKIVKMKSVNEQIIFLEEILAEVSDEERLANYDVWAEDAQKILFDLQAGINIEDNPKYK